MKKKEKGSLTIFAVLSLMLVAALMFVLLEGARMNQIQNVAKMKTQTVLESVFSNYDKEMWDKYQVLVLDDGQTDEQGAFASWEWYAKELSEKNISSGSRLGGIDHLSMAVEQVSFEEYRLITDDAGEAYIAAVASYMKENLAGEMITQLMSQYQSLNQMDVSETPDSSAIDGAEQAIEEAKKQAESETSEESEGEAESKSSDVSEVTGESIEPIEITENPLDVIKNIWTSEILTLVLEDTTNVSKAQESMKNAVSNRQRSSGTSADSVKTELLDDVLLSEYLLEHFASYTSGTATGVLQYELEYMLCGNASDEENLCAAAERLLAVREAANLVALAKDAQKQEIAYGIALSLAGVTANPIIVYAVKAGILAAWALAESILDVRTLLSGGKIAVVKSSAQWTSDVLSLGSALGDGGKAISCTNGLSYQEYLRYLLAINTKKTVYRAMDLQELAIQSLEGKEGFSMDNMVIDATLSIEYSYKTIFLGMETITSRMGRTFTIRTQENYSYRKAGA